MMALLEIDVDAILTLFFPFFKARNGIIIYEQYFTSDLYMCVCMCRQYHIM